MKIKIEKLIRKCPICQNDIGEILYKQKFKLPETHLLSSLYNIVECNKCKFVFADSSSNQRDYNMFYQNMSKYEDKLTASGGGDTSYDLERLRQTASDIQKILPEKNSSILDIGCGNGGLLCELKKNGFNNLTGLDPSQNCVSNIKEKGINAYQGGISSDNYDDESIFLNKKFDFIILSHVFEHIYDLQVAVSNIQKLLNNNGLLYIEVPDASRYKDHFIVPYYYFDIEHINHFDENSLKNLFLKYDFEFITYEKKIMKVSNTVNYPAIYLIFQAKKNTGYQITFNSIVRESIEKYILISKEKEFSSEIVKLSQIQDEIVIWGAGSFTQRLLSNTELGNCNIIAYIDKDSKKQGLKINNIEIYPPLVLNKYNCTIIVCSALFSDEIIQEIKSMNLNNKIIVIK